MSRTLRDNVESQAMRRLVRRNGDGPQSQLSGPGIARKPRKVTESSARAANAPWQTAHHRNVCKRENNELNARGTCFAPRILPEYPSGRRMPCAEKVPH